MRSVYERENLTITEFDTEDVMVIRPVFYLGFVGLSAYFLFPPQITAEDEYRKGRRYRFYCVIPKQLPQGRCLRKKSREPLTIPAAPPQSGNAGIVYWIKPGGYRQLCAYSK